MKTAEILLSQGYVAVVDSNDAQRIEQYDWLAHTSKTGAVYAYRRDAEGKTVFMHREIMMAGDDPRMIDHANGNTLDNRRVNLRFATAKQNAQNRRPIKDKTSKFKGVRWCPKSKKWRAEIRPSEGYKHLGFFDCERMAAHVYNCEALRQYGHFAWLNEVVNG